MSKFQIHSETTLCVLNIEELPEAKQKQHKTAHKPKRYIIAVLDNGRILYGLSINCTHGKNMDIFYTNLSNKIFFTRIR